LVASGEGWGGLRVRAVRNLYPIFPGLVTNRKNSEMKVRKFYYREKVHT
jgi:hypothetical protein